jgi:predicted site-specific integrase-resolvase
MENALSIKQFADAVGVKPATVWRWIQRGWILASQLPGHRGAYRIRPSEVERILAGNRPYRR